MDFQRLGCRQVFDAILDFVLAPHKLVHRLSKSLAAPLFRFGPIYRKPPPLTANWTFASFGIDCWAVADLLRHSGLETRFVAQVLQHRLAGHNKATT